MKDEYLIKKRIYLIACAFSAAALVGAVIYMRFDMRFSGQLDICLVKKFLHVYCLGCGGTRAFDFMMEGRIIESLKANPLAVNLVLLYLSYFAGATYTFLIKKDGKIYYNYCSFVLKAVIVITAVFFIIRNFLMICCGYDFLGDCVIYWNT